MSRESLGAVPLAMRCVAGIRPDRIPDVAAPLGHRAWVRARTFTSEMDERRRQAEKSAWKWKKARFQENHTSQVKSSLSNLKSGRENISRTSNFRIQIHTCTCTSVSRTRMFLHHHSRFREHVSRQGRHQPPPVRSADLVCVGGPCGLQAHDQGHRGRARPPRSAADRRGRGVQPTGHRLLEAAAASRRRQCQPQPLAPMHHSMEGGHRHGRRQCPMWCRRPPPRQPRPPAVRQMACPSSATCRKAPPTTCQQQRLAR